MNFFEQQDRANRNTKHLILLLCLAVLSLIAITTLLLATAIYLHGGGEQLHVVDLGFWQGISHAISVKMFIGIGAGVCGIIFLGGLYKLFQFSGGGKTVAEALGGRLINMNTANADERKVLNVVEEMAIASGTPVPPVYVLDDDAINAFAAGHTPQDAVIGITRGCIHLLNRDELQGVIAHEFSHIFHGDMTLNMRLLALLNGILLLGLLGEFLVRSGRPALYARKNKSPIAIMGVGVGLVVIGYTGTFFGGLIKSAVSRQREFLADASAVKFTRNPGGIASALKKIAGYPFGSQLQSDNAAEFSHMYFSEGLSPSYWQLMATHPPLAQRIKRIEPYWDGDYPTINLDVYEQNRLNTERVQETVSNFAPIEFAVNMDSVLNSIAQPTAAHLHQAQYTISTIPDAIHQATHNSWDAQALMLGLVLANKDAEQQQQWTLLAAIYNPSELTSLKTLAAHASALAPELRLPLIELSLPALKLLTPTQYQRFKQALEAMIRADNQVDLLEWAFHRILTNNLEPRRNPSNRLMALSNLQREASILLSAIAQAGNDSTDEARKAFDSSKTIINASDSQLVFRSDYTVRELNIAATRLNHVKPLQKPKLLKALMHCALHNGKITSTEAELFRAIADSLDCPIPPFLPH